jgi:hypothetical protein
LLSYSACTSGAPGSRAFSASTTTGRASIVRDHHGHGLADVAGELLGEDRLLGMADVAARIRRAQHAGRNRERLVGEHGVDARQGQRRTGVDRIDLRVSERRAHERGVQHAGQLEVVHVAAFARDELAVLLAQDRVADATGHGQLLAIWSAAARMLATMFW